MKQGFYFRFYKIIHNEFICCCLANFFYFLYCVLFFIKKVLRKKINTLTDYKVAEKMIEKVYPHPKSEPIYINPAIDTKLDLSIVVPVYNYVEIIEKNIISILNQKTKYKYELILIDDGSTDGAADILKKYETHPIVKVIFQKNAGIGVARNTGINAAGGKYLMFIDCDDIVHDDIVEILLNSAYAGDYDMVMCAHNLSKERNGNIYDVIPNIYPKYNLLRYKNGDEIMNLAGLPWCKVYRREIWNNVRFFPGYWHEDNIIQFLIFMQNIRYKYIPKIEYEYKWYEKNFSHVQGNTTQIKCIDVYWILVDILEKYKENNLPLNNAFYTLLLKHISMYYYSCIDSLSEDLIEALFCLARKIYVEYKPKQKVKLPYMVKQVEKAFDKNDIELWKLASSYQ